MMGGHRLVGGGWYGQLKALTKPVQTTFPDGDDLALGSEAVDERDLLVHIEWRLPGTGGCR